MGSGSLNSAGSDVNYRLSRGEEITSPAPSNPLTVWSNTRTGVVVISLCGDIARMVPIWSPMKSVLLRGAPFSDLANYASLKFKPTATGQLHSGEPMTANFANRTIWTGDNLDIMRGMNSESVDLIYLDPPFNSNRNYAAPVGSAAAGAAFKDTWTLSDLDVAWMGLIADEQPAMYQVLQAAGLTHGKGMQSYLCMMGVRLLEMRRLLKDTGSIYLHCDPTASHYLKLLMDAVFGAGQFRNEIIWHYRKWSAGKYAFQRNHDIILFYSRSSDQGRAFNPESTDGHGLRE